MTIATIILFNLSAVFSLNALADYRQVETLREYVYDFSISGGTSNTFINISTAASGTTALPLNTYVKEVTLKVLTPITTSSSSSITFGTQFDPDAFATLDSSDLVSDSRMHIYRLDPTYHVSGTTDRSVGLKISSGVSISAGKLRMGVKSYLFGED